MVNTDFAKIIRGDVSVSTCVLIRLILDARDGNSLIIVCLILSALDISSINYLIFVITSVNSRVNTVLFPDLMILIISFEIMIWYSC